MYIAFIHKSVPRRTPEKGSLENEQSLDGAKGDAVMTATDYSILDPWKSNVALQGYTL